MSYMDALGVVIGFSGGFLGLVMFFAWFVGRD